MGAHADHPACGYLLLFICSKPTSIVAFISIIKIVCHQVNTICRLFSRPMAMLCHAIVSHPKTNTPFQNTLL